MKFVMAFLFSLLMALPAWALDVSALSKLPVLHEGRIKPIASFARLSLGGLNDDAHTRSATQLLALAIFTPADALQTPLFAIDSPALKSLLKLPEQDTPYRYVDVTPALRAHTDLLRQLADKPAAQYSGHEREVWQLYEQIDRLTQLTGALSLLLPIDMPLSDALKARFGIQAAPPYSFASLLPYRRDIDAALKAIIEHKGSNIDAYDAPEQELALVSMQLSALAGTGEGNQLFRVIPSAWQEGEWHSAWETLQQGESSQQSEALFTLWQQAAIAYQNSDQAAWDTALLAIAETLSARSDVHPRKLALETAYYQLDLKSVAIVLLAGSLLAFLAGKLRAAAWLLVGGLLVQAALIASRMIILARPPVSTLYESVLFVAFICVLAGAFAGRRFAIAAPVGAALGAFLLTISDLYAGEGDPMSMPMAVLNTHFWLATHVIIITAGYGASLLAGVLAHLALWRKELASLRHLQTAALWALLLTAVGTILGGVWADQSWGRFWGWDPKENGALLLTLWLAWLLHARMTDYVSRRGFAALLAATNIIVALSWFGVNLLGVGLHSYGFTSAAAIGLFGFVGVEVMVIVLLYLRSRKGKNA